MNPFPFEKTSFIIESISAISSPLIFLANLKQTYIMVLLIFSCQGLNRKYVEFVYFQINDIYISGVARVSENSYSDSGDNDSNVSNLKERKDNWGRIGNFFQVQLPNNQTTMIPCEDGLTVYDLVMKSCEKRHLPFVDHFLMLLVEDNESGLMGKFIVFSCL